MCIFQIVNVWSLKEKGKANSNKVMDPVLNILHICMVLFKLNYFKVLGA